MNESVWLRDDGLVWCDGGHASCVQMRDSVGFEVQHPKADLRRTSVEEVGGGTIYDLHAIMAPAWDYLIVRETRTLRVVSFQSYTHHRHMQ